MMKTVTHYPQALLALAIISPTLCWINLPPIASAFSDSIALVSWGLAAGALLATAWPFQSVNSTAWIIFRRPALAVCAILIATVAWQLSKGDYGFIGDVVSFLYAATGALAIFATGTFLSINEKHRERIAVFFAFSFSAAMCLNAIAGWVQYLDIDIFHPYINPLRDPGRIFGNFRQPNHYAIYTWWGIVATVWLRTSGKISNFAYLIFISLGASALVFSGSRTVRIFLLLAIGSAFLLWRSDRKYVIKSTITVAALYGLIFFLAAIASNATKFQLFGYERMAEGDATGERLQLWINVIKILPDIPWTGCGIHQFNFCWTHLTPPEWVQGTVSNAHNLILNSIIELGWIATTSTFIWIIFIIIRSSSSAMRNREWFLFLNIALTGMIAAMLEYPMSYMYLLIPVAFCLGCLQGIAIGKTSGQNFTHQPTTAPTLVRQRTMAAFVAAYFSIGGFMYGSQYATIASLFSGNADKARIDQIAHEAWLFTPTLQFAMTLWVSEDMTEENAKELLPFFSSAGRSALSPGFLARYAFASALAGEQDMARHLAWRAISMEPKLLNQELAPQNISDPNLQYLKQYLSAPYPVSVSIEKFKITSTQNIKY